MTKSFLLWLQKYKTVAYNQHFFENTVVFGQHFVFRNVKTFGLPSEKNWVIWTF